MSVKTQRITGTRTAYYVANLYPEGMGGATKHPTLEDAERCRQSMKQRGYTNVHVWRKTVEYVEEPPESEAWRDE